MASIMGPNPMNTDTNFPSFLQSAEDERRKDDYYEPTDPNEDRGDLRDDGRSDGYGESYAERNA